MHRMHMFQYLATPHATFVYDYVPLHYISVWMMGMIQPYPTHLLKIIHEGQMRKHMRPHMLN